MRPATPEAYKLLHEGTLALSNVEHNGFRIDQRYLTRTLTKAGKKIKRLEESMRNSKVYTEWRKHYGSKTNLDSRSQLHDIIFTKLQMPKQEIVGVESEDDDGADYAAFAHLLADVPFLNKYFKCQKYKKAMDTSLAGIVQHQENGYIHATHNLNIAISFRSSVNDPNLQNLPIRNPEFGNLVRRAFIPRRKDWMLAEIDFGALEVCSIACYNKDPRLISYIKHGKKKDMHLNAAMRCYKLPPKEVSKMIRYCGKNMFVFPQFYGSYYLDCAASLWRAVESMELKTESGVPLRDHLNKVGLKNLGACNPKEKPKKGTFEHHIQECETYLWNEEFTVYRDWRKEWYNRYLKRGYFHSLTGFLYQGVYRRNEVINLPNQGTAFHCLLWSVIQLDKWLTKKKMKSKIVNQIHDSMILDLHPKEAHDVLHQAKHIMTEAIREHWKWIIVPLTVEAEVSPPGMSWADKEEYKFT